MIAEGGRDVKGKLSLESGVCRLEDETSGGQSPSLPSLRSAPPYTVPSLLHPSLHPHSDESPCGDVYRSGDLFFRVLAEVAEVEGGLLVALRGHVGLGGGFGGVPEAEEEGFAVVAGF